MMNKNKSPLRKLAKYLSVLPLVLLLITANSVYAQQNKPQQEIAPPPPPPPTKITTATTPPPPAPPANKVSKSNEVYMKVDRLPEFPGGTKELMHWLGENIQYPKEAQEKRIEGRVIVNFTVEKNGSIADVKVVRGQDPLLDAEALRVVPLMPNWYPGELNKEIVRVMYTLPIIFRLTAEDKARGSSSSVIGFASSDKEGLNEVFVLGNGSKKDGSPQSFQFDGKKPLIIVDDVKMKKDFNLNSIKSENVVAITVLKNEGAIKKYGEEGKDGVLEVTTKKTDMINSAKRVVSEKLGIDGDDVFVIVENQPEFPGGKTAMMNYLAENVKYPEEAHKNGIQGRVIVTFIVNKDGSLSEIEVIRGQDPSLDAEAIRVISAMPNWRPGTQRGEAVNVRFTLPIVFRLENGKEVKSEDISEVQKKPSILTRRDQKTDSKFYEFTSKEIKYPLMAQENGISGLVRASYDVNSNGIVSNIKITKSVNPSLDAELKRVIQLMPNDVALLRSEGKAASNIPLSVNFIFEDTKMEKVTSQQSDLVLMAHR